MPASTLLRRRAACILRTARSGGGWTLHRCLSVWGRALLRYHMHVVPVFPVVTNSGHWQFPK